MKIETIQAAMLTGGRDAVALALDSTAFERAGNRLEHGLLKHLDQFNRLDILLLSEVIRGELRAHLLKRTQEAQQALSSAIAASSDNWPNTDVQRKAALETLLGPDDASALVEKRIEAFIARCGVVSIPANLASMDEVLRRYFSVEPPFEDAAKKKSEFPDAIALLSIESWAQAHAKPVIVVSADGGWKAFAEKSDLLCCVPELSQALAMFQQRNEQRLELVALVAAFIDAATDWEGFELIRDALDHSVEWQAEAYSAYDFEVEMDVQVVEVWFSGLDAAESLRLIDYDGKLLTVYASMDARLMVDAQFGFIYDGVDMGSATSSGTSEISLEAVLSFRVRPDLPPELESVDLAKRRHRIEFGDVEPDHSVDQDYDEE